MLGGGCPADAPAPAHTDVADTAVVPADTGAPLDTDISYGTDTDGPLDADLSYDTHSDASPDTDTGLSRHTGTVAPPTCRWFEGAAEAWARDGTFDGHRSYLVCTADPLLSAACDAIAAQTRPRPGGPNAALQDLVDEILGVPMCPIDTDSGSPGETGWDTAGACRMYAWDVVHTCGPVDDGTHTCCFTVRVSFSDIP